jgi:hypothetical protein
MIIKGHMTYDQYGRKRKSKYTKAVKSKRQEWKTFAPEPSFRRTTEQYPSAPLSQYITPQDNSYKQKESENYTVSIAYNKGAYQVIPKEEVKHIGK